VSYTDLQSKFKKIGKNVTIGSNVYFRYPEAVEIGDEVIIDDFSYFTTSLNIGSFVHIGPHCSIIGGVKSKLIMGDFSGMSAGCRIVCGSDDYLRNLTNPSIPRRFRDGAKVGVVTLSKHAVLGTNTVVHPMVHVKEGAATGSCALVTQDLDDWSVYIGCPARKYQMRDKERILSLEREFMESRI